MSLNTREPVIETVFVNVFMRAIKGGNIAYLITKY